jgi:hypothetical protein
MALLGCSGEGDAGSPEFLGRQRSTITACDAGNRVCEIDSANAVDHADIEAPGSIAWYFHVMGPGYTYKLLPGVFGISKGIKVPSGSALTADSTGTVRIYTTAGWTSEPSPMIWLSDDSTLSKLRIDGDGKPRFIVDARSTSSATISECILRESKTHVVTADLSTDFTVFDSTVSYAGIDSSRDLPSVNGPGAGINCFHCFDLKVTHSDVNYTRTSGIYMGGTLGAEIAYNKIFEISWNMLVSEPKHDQESEDFDEAWVAWSAGDGITAYHNNSNPYPVNYRIYGNEIWLFHNNGIHVSGDDIQVFDNYINGHNDNGHNTQSELFGHSALWVGDHRPFPGGECSKNVTISNNTLYRGHSPWGAEHTVELGIENYQSSTYQHAGNTGRYPFGHSLVGDAECDLFHASPEFSDLDVEPTFYYEFRQGGAVDTMLERNAEPAGNAGTVVDERLGRVLQLDGDGDALRIPHHPYLSAPAFSVFALIKPTRLGQTMQIFSKDCSSCPKRSWQFRLTNDGRLELIVFTSPSQSSACSANAANCFATASSGPETVAAGQWSYVAGTYDGATIRIYHAPLEAKELVEVDSQSFAGPLPNLVSDAYIGRAETTNRGYFLGRIDDVAFFQRALTREDFTSVIQWGHMVMPDLEILHP